METLMLTNQLTSNDNLNGLNAVQRLGISAGLNRNQVNFPWFATHHIEAYQAGFTFDQWRESSLTKVLAVLHVGFSFEYLSDWTEEDMLLLIYSPEELAQQAAVLGNAIPNAAIQTSVSATGQCLTNNNQNSTLHRVNPASHAHK